MSREQKKYSIIFVETMCLLTKARQRREMWSENVLEKKTRRVRNLFLIADAYN